jgi:hypothetical protein
MVFSALAAAASFGSSTAPSGTSSSFMVVGDLPAFTLDAKPHETKVYHAGFDWNELVVSWNVKQPAGAILLIEARAVFADRESRWYTLGSWSLDASVGPRESVNGQKDGDGEVMTDTLRLARPGAGIQLRITARKQLDGQDPQLDLIALNFSRFPMSQAVDDPLKSVWGRVIDVPQRSQMSYPGGNVLCSPTCVSMVLWHWAKVLGRPELDRDVPDVQAGVHDPNWPGTGNWPFNTAFAGSFDGLRAYVTRLRGIREAEQWIEAGIPVITSVSYGMLKGGERTRNDGHLVVLVGFTSEGDPVFNDPGRGQAVRQVYRRSDFERAWRHSGRTVYLVHPVTVEAPPGRDVPWLVSPK